jgi:putative heme-binding domain-containing protein
MAFNPPENDFDGTAGDLFIAFYGPGERWNRGAIGRLRMHRKPDGSYQIEEFPVATGIPKISDLEFGAHGDLYVAHVGKTDYWYQPVDEVDGAFYRLIHAPWIQPAPMDTTIDERVVASESTLERGRQLFAERACSACHEVDGKTELIGPNLKDIGRLYSRAELLEEIMEPSQRIKPSMTATRITRHNGEVLLGRVVSTDAQSVQLMIIGNRIVDVPRVEIQTEEPVMESLMYEGLLQGLTEEDVDALLAYLINLHQANEVGG